ncbi:MAG: LacI family DNA-binding transcriptional regulator [Sedimentisphaeraceae bacterium JB056]
MAALVEKVASKAGVSIATVSRVMNNHPNVSNDKVEMVRKAIKDLNINKAITRGSKSLRSANTVAFVVTNRNAATSYSYVLTETIHRVSEVLADRGYNTILADISEGKELPRIFTTSSVAGMILSGDIKSEKVLSQIKDIPQVWVTSHYSEGKDIALAGNEAVGRVAAQYVLSRGHKSALLVSPFRSEPYNSRCDFFEYTCMRNNIEVSRMNCNFKMPGKNEILDMNWFNSVAYDLAKKFLGLENRPTSVFIPSDMITGSFYRGLYENGVIPGKDFEVISCGNDLLILASLYPIPTTIDIGPKLMAERAVEQLLWRINNQEEERNFKAFIEPILIKSPDIKSEKFGQE